MAKYLIGDIQGCYDALRRALDEIRFDPEKDSLVCAGDLVNRGGQSLQVLRLLESMGGRAISVLGNHDLSLLALDARFPDGGAKNRELNKILNAPDREKLIGWLRRQPLAHWSEKHQLLIVHAGVIPQWSVEKTLLLAAEVEAVLRSRKKSRKFFARTYHHKPRLWHDDMEGWDRLRLISNIMTRIRTCKANGTVLLTAKGPPGSQPKGYLPWFKHKHRKTRNVTVAFGHWAALGHLMKKRLIALDSGCVWGGNLTIVRVKDRMIYQVPKKALPKKAVPNVRLPKKPDPSKRKGLKKRKPKGKRKKK